MEPPGRDIYFRCFKGNFTAFGGVDDVLVAGWKVPEMVLRNVLPVPNFSVDATLGFAHSCVHWCKCTDNTIFCSIQVMYVRACIHEVKDETLFNLFKIYQWCYLRFS